MNVKKCNLYLFIAVVCLFPNISIAQEEDLMTEEGMVEEEGKAAEEGMMEEAGPAAEEGAVAEEGLVEEEGMLEEEAEELPPLYTSEIEFGVGYSSVDSFKFGEYNGLEEEGFYAIGNLLIRKNSVIGDDDNDYWELSGSNLGLDTRNLYGEYSHDGTYGEYSKNSAYSVYFEFDQLPHNQLDDAFSLFDGAGTAIQTLPAGFVRSTNTTTMAAANPGVFPSSQQIDVETQRTKVGGGFSWNPAEHWQVTSNYHHEMKEGTDLLGIAFNTGFSGSQSAQLIVPVDFEFDEFDVGIAYADKVKQFDLRYNLSLFRNDDESVTVFNPFIGGTTSTISRISQPPDNSAHQVTLTSGYNLGLTSRLSGTLSYSKMLQDDSFLPFSIDNTLCPTFTSCLTALPQRDLDGEVEKWFGNLNYSIRPLQDLDLGARYTFNKWDNNTPRNLYFRVRQDTNAQVINPTDSRNRINRPYSFEQHKAELDAGYRLTRNTKLSVGYDYDWNQRDFTEVAITREHTGKVKLAANPFSMSSGWIEYARSDRKGSNYVPNRPFLSNVSAAFIAANAANCSSIVPVTSTACRDNDFLQRKIYLADREQDKVTASLTFMPADRITFGITGSYTDEDYDETQVGLENIKRYSATLDVGYMPRENIDTYAYYTYEFFDRDQAGSDTVQGPPVTNDWLMDTEDRVNTVGAGIKWSKIRDKFDVTANYTFSKSITEIVPTDLTPPAPAAGFQDIVTGIHSFSLQADYNLKDNVIWRLNYLYEHFNSKNWALDGIGQVIPGATNVIALGNQSPDYNVHAVGLSVIFKY